MSDEDSRGTHLVRVVPAVGSDGRGSGKLGDGENQVCVVEQLAACRVIGLRTVELRAGLRNFGRLEIEGGLNS